MMLRKLIEIDHGKSELNKRKVEPLIFKVRRSLNRRKIQQSPQQQLMSQ
jgi:hypothetical protein